MMKMILFAFCILCTATALGQSTAGIAALTSQAHMLTVPDHPEHASQHAMAPEQSLLSPSGFLYARGERPLWEFAPKTETVPLGDVARIFRKEHLTAKKAVMVMDN